MLAVVGVLTVEALGRGPWWEAVNPVGMSACSMASANILVAVQVTKRWQDEFIAAKSINELNLATASRSAKAP